MYTFFRVCLLVVGTGFKKVHVPVSMYDCMHVFLLFSSTKRSTRLCAMPDLQGSVYEAWCNALYNIICEVMCEGPCTRMVKWL